MVTSRYLALVISAVAFLGLSVSTAGAQTLLGIGNGELYSIDTTTAVATLIGTTTFPGSASGMDYRGGKLYVLPESSGNIYEIDPSTGATIGGPIAITGPDPGLEGDFAFRADGVAFATRGLGTGLWTFDLSLPVPTYTKISNVTPAIDGLAFNAAGVLYGLEEPGKQLHTIDQVTGVATPIGAGTGIIGGGTDVGGLAFDSTGNLFALCSRPTPVRLYSIDVVTGVATLIGNPSKEVRGIRFGTIVPPGPGATITQSGGTTNVTEGGASDSYTVILKTAPTANVTITLNPGTQVTVAPATLTFTPANWNVAQTVTVTAVDDALVEGPHIGTITHTSASADAAYNAIAIASVTANITDNDAGPPGGGIGEGDYPGSKGLGNGNGGEGTFGFGRQTRILHPFLKGPHRDPQGAFRVFNDAHRQQVQATDADSGLGVLGWALLGLSVLAPAALVFSRRRGA